MLKKALLAIATLCFFIKPTFAGHPLPERPRNTTIYVASVQFPPLVKELPDMRAYFGGNKITCEKDKDLHRLLFTLTTEYSMRKLYLLVVENSLFEYEDNTPLYRKVNPKSNYKLWSLELMHKHNTDISEQKLVGGIKLNADEKSPYYWIIRSETIDPVTGKVPDNTFVLIYDPKLIDRLEGGTSVELPKVIITSNILEIVGSEEKLQDISTRYLLSALDSDTFHSRSQFVVTPQPDCNRVTICTT